jgi:predicted GIY-YIG superfamily endonuclease
MEVIQLPCDQLPGVAMLEIRGGGPSSEFLGHAHQFVGLLKGITERRSASKAFHYFLDSEAGTKLKENDGGDLQRAMHEGPLVKMMYTYRLQKHRGSPSSYVTVAGMLEIMDGLPNTNITTKNKLQEIFANFIAAGGSVPLSFAQAVPSMGSTTTVNQGIYVLRIENRPKPFFYVGKADDIERRIKQHTDGGGAYCITGEQFTRVDPLTNGSVYDMESWERNEVLTRMHQFGIDNVRGWMYTFKHITMEQKVSAFDQICEKFDFCRKCGRNSHFVRDCHSMSTDLWTCGMELRQAYAGNHAAALDDASRRIAEAREMINSAARLLGGGRE